MTVVSMPCVRCGQPGYAAGADLLCATHGGVPDAAAVEAIVGAGAPSPLWQICTALLLAAGAAQAALQAVNVWAVQRVNTVIDSPAGTVPLTEVAGSFRFAASFRSTARDALWAYLICFLLWFVLISGVATRLGHDRHAVLRHWTMLVWRVALVPTLVFAVLAGQPDPTDWAAVHAVNENAAVFSVAHILTTGLLMAYAIVVWRRLRPEPLPELV